MDINADPSCSRTAVLDMAIKNSLGPGVTMAMGDSAGLSNHHGFRSSVVAGLQRGCGCQYRPSTSAQPSVIIGVVDINIEIS